jgi:predicted transcriptional regulator
MIMATNDAKRLLEMKEQTEKAQRESDQTQGALDELGKRLKTEFDVKSTAEADKLLLQIDKDLEKVDGEIADKTKELEDRYEWN